MNPIDLDKDGDVDKQDAIEGWRKLMFWKQAYPFGAGLILGGVGGFILKWSKLIF